MSHAPLQLQGRAGSVMHPGSWHDGTGLGEKGLGKLWRITRPQQRHFSTEQSQVMFADYEIRATVAMRRFSMGQASRCAGLADESFCLATRAPFILVGDNGHIRHMATRLSPTHSHSSLYSSKARHTRGGRSPRSPCAGPACGRPPTAPSCPSEARRRAPPGTRSPAGPAAGSVPGRSGRAAAASARTAPAGSTFIVLRRDEAKQVLWRKKVCRRSPAAGFATGRSGQAAAASARSAPAVSTSERIRTHKIFARHSVLVPRNCSSWLCARPASWAADA